MRRIAAVMAIALGSLAISDSAFGQSVDARIFAVPPAHYRPTVSADEGAGYAAPLGIAARRAIVDLDAGGVMFNPQGDPLRRKPLDIATTKSVQFGLLDQYPPHASPWLPRALPGEARLGSYMADGRSGPGKPASLGYLTPAWFAAASEVLDMARRNGRHATFYDEAGFPSGSADRTIPSRYHRKLLRREETTTSTGQPYVLDFSTGERPLAVVAVDSASGQRLDLMASATENRINWTPPHGNWRVQRYFVAPAVARPFKPDYHGTADYLDAEATDWFIQNSYEKVYAGLSEYFGSTIKYTFFDDVGILSDEKTWHPSIANRFEQITGRSATLYYPALWDDIGPETAAARVGFFRARSEILGETFPKRVTERAHAHKVLSTGHAPGNYDLQPTDTIGDPFKFYAYMDVPLADVLWGLGFARGGFKLISSVSAQRDLPMTGAEAFSVNNDANGYRRLIELFVRGINHFVIGGRVPSKPRGTPSEFNQWAGRSSYLLQGGRHVADIAIVFPIESLQAFYSFNAPLNTVGLPFGTYVYRDADYQAVGEMLVSEMHRDFTFIHPEALASGKTQVCGNTLLLENKVNREEYRAVILPGGSVISVATLGKLKSFWEAGGTIIATSLLPDRSAEFGRDNEVRALVTTMFGTPDERSFAPGRPNIRRSAAGGQAMFLPHPSADDLSSALEVLQVVPDISFARNPAPTRGNGTFGYIHRVRDGKDIYYLGNSSDDQIDTQVTLRGRLSRIELWDPHTGRVTPVRDIQFHRGAAGPLTSFRVVVPPVSSVAIVGFQRQ